MFCGNRAANFNGYGPDGQNVVGFADLGQGTTTLALSKIWVGAISGRVQECDLALNTAYSWSALSDNYCPLGLHDVENTAAHELGHWIVLNHSSDMYATMYRYLPEEGGETLKRTLANDDIAGIRSIYGEPKPPKPPDGGCARDPVYPGSGSGGGSGEGDIGDKNR